VYLGDLLRVSIEVSILYYCMITMWVPVTLRCIPQQHVGAGTGAMDRKGIDHVYDRHFTTGWPYGRLRQMRILHIPAYPKLRTGRYDETSKF